MNKATALLLLSFACTGCSVVTSEHIRSGEAWQKVGIPYHLPKTVFSAELEIKPAGSGSETSAYPSTFAPPSPPTPSPFSASPAPGFPSPSPPAGAPAPGVPGYSGASPYPPQGYPPPSAPPESATSTAVPSYGEPGEHAVRLTIKQQLVPDPNHTYVLQYHPATFNTDRVTVELTPNGLLRSLFTSGLSNAGSAVGGASAATPGYGSYGTGYAGAAYGGTTPSQPGYSPYGASPSPSYGTTPYGAAPTPGAPPSPPDALDAGRPLQLLVQTRDIPPSIAAELLPDLELLRGKHEFVFSPDTPLVEWEVRDVPTRGRLSVRLTTTKVIQKKAVTPAKAEEVAEDDYDNDGVKFKIAQASEVIFTLLYRPAAGAEAAGAVQLGHVRTVALMANDSEVFTLPLDRYLFVEATFANTFHNGQLTYSEIQKPSFPRRVAAVPVAVLDAFLDLLRGIGSAGARTFLPAAAAVGTGVPLPLPAAGAGSYSSSVPVSPSYSTPSYSTPSYPSSGYTQPSDSPYSQ